GTDVRVRDLAARFGVSHVTVSRTVDRLQRDGWVQTEPYRAIELTQRGAELAVRSRKRHAVVLRFLLALGISPPAALADAEGIEHHVSPTTLDVLRAFADERPLAHDLEEVVATLQDSATDASRFARVREAHATELVEDYVEAISDVGADGTDVRVRDLAARFGVSHVTVSRTLGRLQRDGYVDTAPYRPVTLTDRGRALAERSRARHETVLAFLLALGVERATAEIDAEGVEHHVGDETLERFRTFTQR
ncbi:MAG: manganese-binding transcriptional regulator MntR, partial [Planctomycetota bacterium]